MNVRPGSRVSASSCLPASSPPSARVELRRDVGMADDFEIAAARRRRVDAQHLLRGAIHQLQPSLSIDDQHAFDHAGEDGLHARAIARQLFEPAAQFLHGRHRARARPCRARRSRSRRSAA